MLARRYGGDIADEFVEIKRKITTIRPRTLRNFLNLYLTAVTAWADSFRPVRYKRLRHWPTLRWIMETTGCSKRTASDLLGVFEVIENIRSLGDATFLAHMQKANKEEEALRRVSP